MNRNISEITKGQIRIQELPPSLSFHQSGPSFNFIVIGGVSVLISEGSKTSCVRKFMQTATIFSLHFSDCLDRRRE